jgi:hypothetical protein
MGPVQDRYTPFFARNLAIIMLRLHTKGNTAVTNCNIYKNVASTDVEAFKFGIKR